MARYPLGQPLRLSTTTSQLNLDGSYTLINSTTLTLVVVDRRSGCPSGYLATAPPRSCVGCCDAAQRRCASAQRPAGRRPRTQVPLGRRGGCERADGERWW